MSIENPGYFSTKKTVSSEDENDYEPATSTAEQYENNIFKDYLSSLGLEIEALKNKKILDIGAGERYFASYCLKNNINDDVYSLDPNIFANVQPEFKNELWSEDVKKRIDSKTVVALQEATPMKNDTFDLVLVHAAMPGFSTKFDRNENIQSIEKSYDEIFRILKPGGEARLAYFASRYQDNHEKNTLAKLRKLNSYENCEVSIEPIEGNAVNMDRIVIKKLNVTKNK